MRKFDARFPFFKELAKEFEDAMGSRGYIRTLLGRRRRIANHDFHYKSLNGAIQGSAADQMKTAMHRLYYQHDILPLAQIHDELGVSVPKGDEPTRKLIVKEMVEAVELRVPVIVEGGYGSSWADAK